jgi:hypothetical protein
MLVWLGGFFLLIVGAGWIAYHVDAQEKYDPTELEVARLEVKLRDVQIAQIAYTQAQAAFQQSVNDFNATVEDVKKAHKWPAEVVLDQSVLGKREIKFVKPPAPPVPSAAAKAPEPKKP